MEWMVWMAWHGILVYPCFAPASTASRPVRDTVPTAPYLGSNGAHALDPRQDLGVFSRPRGWQQANPIWARVPSLRARHLPGKGGTAPSLVLEPRRVPPQVDDGMAARLEAVDHIDRLFALRHYRVSCQRHGPVARLARPRQLYLLTLVLASLRVPRSKRASSRWILAQLLGLCSSPGPGQSDSGPRDTETR